MVEYKYMYRVNPDGSINDEEETIQVDVHVKMRLSSVSGSARWGQTIGTSGMSDCHGLVVFGNGGAWLAHNFGDDHSFDVPQEFRGGTSFILLGNKYASTGWASGRSNFAFALDEEGVTIYVSGADEQPDATGKALSATVRRSSGGDADSLSSSYDESIFDKYDLPPEASANDIKS